MKSNSRIISLSRLAMALFFVLSLCLVACAPPASPPAPVLPPVNINDVLLEEACKSNMDLNLPEAYFRFRDSILWTFHISFMKNDDPSQPGTMLGCLRYFWRDNTTESFKGEGILANAIAVVCSIHDNVGMDIAPEMGSSAGRRDWPGDETMPGRQATFIDGGFLECPLDIKGSFAAVAQRDSFQEAVRKDVPEPDATAALSYTMPITAPYPEFTAIAAVARFTEGAAQYPLFLYEPNPDQMPEGLTPDPYVTQFSLELNSAKYRAEFGEMSYETSQPDADCLVNFPTDNAYFWLDFGRCYEHNGHNNFDHCEDKPENIDQQYLQFAYKWPTTEDLTSSQVCRRTEVSEIPPNVPFYMGPATLTINFPGDLYEIWVDPDSAVKTN